jgi:hypothetical protein
LNIEAIAMPTENEVFFREARLAKISVPVPEGLFLGDIPERVERIIHDRFFQFFYNTPGRADIGDRQYVGMVLSTVKRSGDMEATQFILGMLNELEKINRC